MILFDLVPACIVLWWLLFVYVVIHLARVERASRSSSPALASPVGREHLAKTRVQSGRRRWRS